MADKPKPTYDELEELYVAECRKTKELQTQNTVMRKRLGVQQTEFEAEEEQITNKLLSRIEDIEKEKAALSQRVESEERRLKQEKTLMESKLNESVAHLAKLKHEKEALARQVEQEEEFLTNTLQMKLARVEQERAALENRLEQEQEYITNKLQKQIAEAAKEKCLLEVRIKEEKDKVASMEEEKRKLQDQLRQLRLSVEVEEECISNKLQKTIESIRREKEDLQRKLDSEHDATITLGKELEKQRSDLRKLQDNNFVMQQRIQRESGKLFDMQRDKASLAQCLEMEWERQLNCLIRSREQPDRKAPQLLIPLFARSNSCPRVLPCHKYPEEYESEGSSAAEAGENGLEGPADGDVVGELSNPAMSGLSRRRSCRWETQSLPCFSPRLSPFPSPRASSRTSSRSRSPFTIDADATPTSSRSQSPSKERERRERRIAEGWRRSENQGPLIQPIAEAPIGSRR